jgi:hypothetical protein
LRRRSAVEPVIGHAKGEHSMGRNYLAGQEGDAINAVLTAAGYNFRRLLAWLAILLAAVLIVITRAVTLQRLIRVLHGRLDSVLSRSRHLIARSNADLEGSCA